MAKFCKYCGAPLDEKMEFCKNCGRPVRAANSQRGKVPDQQQESYGGQFRQHQNSPREQSRDFYGGASRQSRDYYGRDFGQSQDPYGRQSGQSRDYYGRDFEQSQDPYRRHGGQSRDFYGRQDEKFQEFYDKTSKKRSGKAKKRRKPFEKEKKSGRFGLPKSVIPLGIVLGVIAVALAALLVLFVVTLTSDGVDTSSPENVVGSFYDKLKDQDMEGALACFSSEDAAKNFDYESYVALYDLEDQDTLLPAEDTKIQLINERKLEGQAAGQIEATLRVIGLGEDTGRRSIQGVSSWQELGMETEDYIEAVDSKNLKDLTVERVELAVQDVQNQDETQEKLEQEAGVYGADERREYVALFTVGETSYIQGFTLDRYGEDWRIFSLTSELAGTSSYGIPSVADQTSDFEKYTK